MVGRVVGRKGLLQEGWIEVGSQQSREPWQRFQMNTSTPTFFYSTHHGQLDVDAVPCVGFSLSSFWRCPVLYMH